MRLMVRMLCTTASVMLVAAGCGGGNPGAPSEVAASAGATIAGTVNGGNPTSAAAAHLAPTEAGAPSGMTVTIVGTNRSAAVDTSGRFFIEGVPAGTVELQFVFGSTKATGRVPNVNRDELIRVQVTVSGTTATIVEEQRTTGKVSLCHTTGNGQYHMIEVSVSAEPAHRDHGDGAVGDPVPADPTKSFSSSCQVVGAAVRLEKSTNGQDADEAPGPTITVGSAVSWQYAVTNTGTEPLSGVAVSDDRGVTVSCPKTVLAPGESMTCTGSGTATAGQYRNVGTVTANWSSGTVQDTDASHYFGQGATQEEGPKVQLCHRTGNGSYIPIEVSQHAEPAHRAHGDGKIGEAVPGSPGKVFGANCSVS